MLSKLGTPLLRRPYIYSSLPTVHHAFTPARSYALSRQPERDSRSRIIRNVKPRPIPRTSQAVVEQNQLLMEANPNAGGLENLLAHDALVVTRQIEMMNIFMGFEVANRYAINDENGNILGYLAEEERGFLGTFARQLFKTHRAFRSVVMDANGTPVLWIHRPFSWINSRLYVQRKLTETDPKTGEEITTHVNFGEAKQEWHPWRRRYHLFLGHTAEEFRQFAQIDSGLLAWNFFLQNEGDANVGSIRKGWTGLGREFFTDTSQYTIRFTPDPEAPSANVSESGEVLSPALYTPLSLEQRALVLALSVGIDFDYFSRHSEGGSGIPWYMLIFAAAE